MMNRNYPYKNQSNKEISITFMSGPRDGEKLIFPQPDLSEDRIISIGRREGCDIHISFDNQVSRLHARLGCVSVPTTGTDSGINPFVLAFWLEDVGSRNGTYIEKQENPIEERVSLRPGVLFRIGRTWMQLDIPLS